MIRRLFKYSKGSMFLYLSSIVFSMINVFSILYIALIIGKSINLIVDINNVDFVKLRYNLLIIGIFTAIYFIFKFLQDIIINNISNKIVFRLRNEAFNRLMKTRIKDIDQIKDGEVINFIINDIETIKEGLLQGVNQVITGFFTIIGTLFFMFDINLKLTLVVILFTPVSLAFSYIISKGSYKSFKIAIKDKAKLISYTEEMINNQKLMKSLNNENKNIKDFNNFNKKFSKSGFKALMYQSFVNPTTRLINNFIYISIGLLGALIIINDPSKLEVGLLSTFLFYCNNYTKPFNEISVVISNLSQTITSIERVFKFIDLKSNKDGIIKEGIKGNIEFKDVCFSYDGNRLIIDHFNLSVKKGQKVAIVGHTGSGKTTLINLLMKFYEINSGNIFIDNTSIYDYDKKYLRNHLGMVLQDTWLFKGSIKENISYGKENASDKEIIEAAKKVYADSFITKLKDGYDTIVSDKHNLSLGEQQLISIARIMLINPPLLILDEATSNIDFLTEIKINKAFDELMKDKTSIIIAHRLKTIMKSDIIVVLDHGKIMEVGSHNELIKLKGHYYELFNSQFEKY